MGLSRAVTALLLIASSGSALTPEEARAWQDDLRFMVKEMAHTHKDLYHAVSREKFMAMVSALDKRIPSLERHEVIVQMAEIVAAVGDGHTNIYPARDPKIGFHTLPLAFTFFGNELYIRAALESQRRLVGAKVLRIGDFDVSQAYSAVKTMIGHENEQGARYWAQYLLSMPEVLHALRITAAMSDVPMTVATIRGEERIVLHPFAPAEIMNGDTATLFNRREGWIDARDLGNRNEPLWLRRTTDAFHFEHDGDMLYVQVNKIGDDAGETLAQFSHRLHDEISSTKPQKVAIDLRLNRGGDATLAVPLVRSLIQSESIDQKGRLFAIIGPATFSAAQNFADALEKYTNVTFVGEPTGSRETPTATPGKLSCQTAA